MISRRIPGGRGITARSRPTGRVCEILTLERRNPRNRNRRAPPVPERSSRPVVEKSIGANGRAGRLRSFGLPGASAHGNPERRGVTTSRPSWRSSSVGRG